MSMQIYLNIDTLTKMLNFVYFPSIHDYIKRRDEMRGGIILMY